MNHKIGLAELDAHEQRAVRKHGDRLLTLADCAARTGHKVSTWRAWVLLRKIPYHKIFRSVRVSESDLERLLGESRIPARED
jgi:hypothetical protein